MTSRFQQIFENTMEQYTRSMVRGGSIARIDPAALKISEIKSDIIKRKGASYLAQLEKMAKDKTEFLVSALKQVRPTTSYTAQTPSSTQFDEADIVAHKAPGIYSSPMTVPLSILISVTDPVDIMQHPIDDDLVHKPNLGKETIEDYVTSGKQPKGTLGANGKDQKVVKKKKK